MLDDELRAAYLAHLGVDAEPPSVAALDRLVVAHLDRVPYETTWIGLGERWTLDPIAAISRIVGAGRGGYCFMLNGALGELLSSLGYTVTRHVGGVHPPGGDVAAALTNHLVLVVSGLEGGSWYVDIGMGDGPAGVMPLGPSTLDQPPYRYSLTPADAPLDWLLTFGPPGGEPTQAMAFSDTPVSMDAFATRHVHLSTSPESGFVRVPTAQRRQRDRVTIVRACTVTRAGAGGDERSIVDRRADWFALLADDFGLTFDGVAPAALDRLWATARNAHEAHQA